MPARRPAPLCRHSQRSLGGLIPRARRSKFSTNRCVKVAALVAHSGDHGESMSLEPFPEAKLRLSQLARRCDHVWQQSHLEGSFRHAIDKLEELWSTRQERVTVLRALAKREEQPRIERGPSRSASNELLRMSDGPVSHELFRTQMQLRLDDKRTASVLRRQLLYCETPTAIYKVIAVALKTRRVAVCLPRVTESIIRAMYRARRSVKDQQVLCAILAVIGRYRINDVPVHDSLYHLAAKFAARARNLDQMKRVLKHFRERNVPMDSNVFRCIVAKFSVGNRGLGEIRNGRWRRSDLLQVLNGFDDCKHLPPEAQYHLKTFIERDWVTLHGWLTALSRCRDVKSLRDEWELWKTNEARCRPSNLQSIKSMNTRSRGDTWFIMQMAYAGGYAEAWETLRESGISFLSLPEATRDRMLELPESVGELDCEAVRNDVLRALDRKLAAIETELGIKWVPSDTDDDAAGHHIMTCSRDEVLDRLGADDWKQETDFGFPYDDNPFVNNTTRELRDAAETTQADAGVIS